tara:strand:- start:397 stop:1644 length:1248 start_codon:yes stop_codon:yes gene_type:complete
MGLKRVVVSGLGALTPIGNDVKEFWENLEKGTSGASKITRFDASNFKTKFACEIKNYDPLNFLEKKETKRLDPYSQYALISTDEAIKDSNINFNKTDLYKVGVIWGSGIGGIKTFYDEVSNYALGGGIPKFNPFFIPKMISDIAAGTISIKYGLKGLNFTTVSACASSSNAIIDSYNYIRLGKANVIITGGSEASVNQAGVGGFNALKALSTRNESPQNASRPFDKDRDGFVLGEGSGTLILEEYDHAIRRNAKIYAEVIGGGLSADAYHITAPHPEGDGAISVMKNAIEDSGIKPEEIDYINVHGTSTPLGDIAEIKAISKVFKNHSYKLNISSTKSMTGHLLGAAGAVEAIASILALSKGIIPPTINNFNLDDFIDKKLNLTLNKCQSKSVKTIMSNTFGFGGHNASLILKRI